MFVLSLGTVWSEPATNFVLVFVKQLPECLSTDYGCVCCRQCSSGLQAVADVAAAIKAGFYSVGLAGGVEAMSQTPMAWEGGVNPRAAKSKKAMSCLIPMGKQSRWAIAL